MDIDYPVVPHAIEMLDPDPNALFYVGDGDHFVLACWAPAHVFRDGNQSKRGAWVHAATKSPWIGQPIGIAPLYYLAVEAAMIERPVPADEAPIAPRGGEGWNCGNGGLASQLSLMLLANACVRLDADTLAHLDGLTNDSGPKFCADLIGLLRRDLEVPF